MTSREQIRSYIACGYTDLRKGIDDLALLVQQEFNLDPFTNTLFLFCGRRRDRIKGLYWEGNGFVLVYKRLEEGTYQWSRSESEVRQITPQQCRWLMEQLRVVKSKQFGSKSEKSSEQVSEQFSLLFDETEAWTAIEVGMGKHAQQPRRTQYKALCDLTEELPVCEHGKGREEQRRSC